MTPVDKAIWFIESHFSDDLSLDAIAAACGVSRFHLSRAFGTATGQSVIGYVRGRRLTQAAGALANGAPNILAVALDAGYGSHEAFTRAFRDQFGQTPDQVRAQRHLDTLTLMEPLKMDQTLLSTLEAPRFETGRPLLIAGLGEHHDCDSSATIPAQWQRFAPHIGAVPGQVGHVTYGVVHNYDDAGDFDYVCGVEVSDFTQVPPDLTRLRIAPARYAVFAHRDHISTIRRTMHTIWSRWLPESGLKPADAPLFERYDAAFDPRTGLGGLEVWLPVMG